MSEYNRCPKCDDYVWRDRHECFRFEAAGPWRGKVAEEDWEEVWSLGDAELAASKFAEEYDRSGDYTIISRGSGEVWIRDSEGIITKWDITAENNPSYHAYAKKEDNK